MPDTPAVMRLPPCAHAVEAGDERPRKSGRLNVELPSDAVRPITIPTLLPLPKLALTLR